MKKILCLIDSLESGGAQRQLVGLAGLLQKRGYKTSVACYHKKVFYAPDIERYGVELIKLTPCNNMLSKFAHVYRLLKEQRYDVVIAYIRGPEVISCLAKIFLRHKYLLIVSERNVKKNMTVLNKLEFMLYSMADYIVSNSYTQNEIIRRKFHFLTKKALAIHNFVDTEYFFPKSYLPNKATRMLVVGRIIPVKNAIGLIKAAKIAKDNDVDFSIDWYGDARDKDYYKLVLQAIDDCQLADIFKFHEATTNIRYQYQDCDLFCLPSFSEGCPNVIVEAMSCGKPILCSNVCDNAIIVKDGVNGFLFDPNDTGDMADAIEKFSNLSQEQKLEFGQKSRQLAIENFSMDSFVEKYIQLIECKNN